MSAPRMTAVFECDLGAFQGNPHLVDTPFGRPLALGIGNHLEQAADPSDPMQDERVKALVEALQGEDERGYRLSPKAHAALRALEQGTP